MPSSRRSPLLSSLLSSLVLVLLLPVATAAPLSEHSASSADALFLRQRPSYKDMPEIGSPAWKALYPPLDVVPTEVPQAWLDALRSAEAKGLIPGPDVNPVATVHPDNSRSYGSKTALDKEICNNGMGCGSELDIAQAPEGMIGVSQDDGPLPPGVRLLHFFDEHQISATHFYVGSNVVRNFGIFLQARAIPGQHFAVHTWSHQYTTGLTNEQVVAEIGWTMQVLADNNFGKIPLYWRPPYGDVDNRVRAIAREIFGLKTIIWYPDPEDWKLMAELKSKDKATVLKDFTTYIQGPKSPGLLPLEHETSDEAVEVFMEAYPLMIKAGWNVTCVPGVWSDPWYKNSVSAHSPNTPGITVVSFDSIGTTSSPVLLLGWIVLGSGAFYAWKKASVRVGIPVAVGTIFLLYAHVTEGR